MKIRYSTIIASCVAVFSAGCGHNIRIFHPLAPPPPVALACSASPAIIYPGDPVTVTATAGSVDTNTKNNVVYSWSGTGVTGNGATASVATGALAPGNYTVKAEVKEGLKVGQSADCSASFTVKAFEPPTISCSASPRFLIPGDTSIITATAMSPQNRPLALGYSATAGTVSGSGATATFSSTGAPTGAVGITCNVSDDRGQTATASTSVVMVEAPVVAVYSPEIKELEMELALHSIFFPIDQPKADDPAGGLVESQQQNLTELATDFKLYLKFKPDAHLILTGHADEYAPAVCNRDLSERRVERTKSFLVEHGVPSGSIEVQALGNQDELSAEQVKQLIEQNPDLSEGERRKMLSKLAVIVPANNRRVDFTLSTTGHTGQHSTRLYPFNAKDALALLISTISTNCVEKAAPAANNNAGGKAFAAFEYPASIDLGMNEPLTQPFLLIAGRVDSVAGINSAVVSSALCESVGALSNCISVSDWNSVLSKCGKLGPQEISAVNAKYMYQFWSINGSLPNTVCATLQPPDPWIGESGKQPDLCAPENNGTFSWRWFAQVKNKSYKGDRETPPFLSLSLSDAPIGGHSILASTIYVKLVPVSLLERVWNRAKEIFLHYLLEWLFGGCGTGIFILLVRHIAKKLGLKWR